MSWLELSVRVPRRDAPLVESLLTAQGALSVTLLDAADTPILEPGVGETPLWPDVRVTGLFEHGVARSRLLDVFGALPGIEDPQRIEFNVLEDRDWERTWMDHFRPMRFGNGLWIVPDGMEVPPEARNGDSQVHAAQTTVRLDPGLAFGTGAHPTTRLCLEWIDGFDCDGKTVLDYGCGSGVLGIAAALKGASRVVCVDNDSQALRATRDNAERNGVSGHLSAIGPDALGRHEADLVLANILASPLIALAPVISESAGKGGWIVLSGILAGQEQEVVSAYRDHGVQMVVAECDGWVRLAGRRGNGTA